MIVSRWLPSPLRMPRGSALDCSDLEIGELNPQRAWWHQIEQSTYCGYSRFN